MPTRPALRRPLLLSAPLLAILLLGSAGCTRAVDAPPKSVVFFTARSTVLDAAANGAIDEFAHDAQSAPRRPILVEGYADPTTSPDDNRKISLARTQAVADALVARGIDRSRISLNPRPPGGTDPGVDSRRVELELGR